MIKYSNDFFTVENVLSITEKRNPDFNEFLKVLKREKPSRNTLFEFFLNEDLYSLLTGSEYSDSENGFLDRMRFLTKAYRNAGYDYVAVPATIEFFFP